jgi:hypothetical protein
LMLKKPCPYCGWWMLLLGGHWVHEFYFCYTATTLKRF